MFKEINEKDYEKIRNSKDENFYFLVFHALWCPPCRAFKAPLEELSQKENVKVYRVNVDENRALSSEFNVSSIPTWFIFKDGKKVYNGNGMVHYQDLRMLVKKLK